MPRHAWPATGVACMSCKDCLIISVLLICQQRITSEQCGSDNVAVLWQILETTAALMKAQSEEDAKGGNSANEARRWTGVRTIVEARSLLKSLFRAASGHKAQVRAVAALWYPADLSAAGRLGCILFHVLQHRMLLLVSGEGCCESPICSNKIWKLLLSCCILKRVCQQTVTGAPGATGV